MFRLLALALYGVAAVEAGTPLRKDPLWPKFAEFVEKFSRQYSSSAEAMGRFENFKDTLARIDALNAKGQEVHGITKFADLTSEEFRRTYNGYRAGMNTSFAKQKVYPADAPKAATASIDWRTKGVVTPVKNQGQCGSCWAFSATEQLESDYILKFGKANTKILSPQQVVSCDTVDAGCNGGNPINAYNYVATIAKGQEYNSDYPYTSGTTKASGTCEFISSDRAADIAQAFIVSQEPSQEVNMLKQIADSPMSIIVDATIWQTYQSGIITTASNCGTALDHAVQVVGYAAGQNYWIVRNSWGTDWGNEGYIYVEAGSNVCGISSLATIVTASTVPTDDEAIQV